MFFQCLFTSLLISSAFAGDYVGSVDECVDTFMEKEASTFDQMVQACVDAKEGCTGTCARKCRSNIATRCHETVFPKGEEASFHSVPECVEHHISTEAGSAKFDEQVQQCVDSGRQSCACTKMARQKWVEFCEKSVMGDTEVDGWRCIEAGTTVQYPSKHVLQHTWCSEKEGVWIRKKDECVWKSKQVGGDERVYCKGPSGKWAPEKKNQKSKGGDPRHAHPDVDSCPEWCLGGSKNIKKNMCSNQQCVDACGASLFAKCNLSNEDDKYEGSGKKGQLGGPPRCKDDLDYFNRGDRHHSKKNHGSSSSSDGGKFSKRGLCGFVITAVFFLALGGAAGSCWGYKYGRKSAKNYIAPAKVVTVIGANDDSMPVGKMIAE